jgi:nucleoside 2-deoxyribosyltransferase
MKIYLAGPMRGKPRFNFGEFARAAKWLRNQGHEVVSPAELDLAEGFDPSNPGEISKERYESWMKRDFAAIEKCDTIALLPGWRMSEGAMREYEFAMSLKMMALVITQYDLDHDNCLKCGWAHPPGTRCADAIHVEGCPHCEVGADHACVMPKGAMAMVGPNGDVVVAKNVSGIEATARATIVAIDKLLAKPGSDWPQTGEVRVTNQLTGGEKGSKPERFDLIPAAALRKVARLYGRGAQKYSAHNWRKGYNWSLSLAALERHLAAFKEGEDFDRETNCEHLASVVFHALALLVYADEHPELDDRWKGKK